MVHLFYIGAVFAAGVAVEAKFGIGWKVVGFLKTNKITAKIFSRRG